MLKLFAFFDLEKLIKIFTALLLERSLLIVSRDLENLTACALAAESLIFPLEWLHTFVPIMPEHVDLHVFNQPFPFIYGVHTCIYDKLHKSQLDNAVILLVDEHQVVNGDQDRLPDNVVAHLTKRLKYFQEATGGGCGGGVGGSDQTDHQSSSSSSSFSSASNTSSISASKTSMRIEKYDLLRTGPAKAFFDSVLMILDDYRDYLCWDAASDEFKINENVFFHTKNVSHADGNNNSNGGGGGAAAAGNFQSMGAASARYAGNPNEFYHEFRITQAFEEVTSSFACACDRVFINFLLYINNDLFLLMCSFVAIDVTT